MKTPLVSICVDTYNQEDYLRDCLDGIVMQKTDFAFEAIVIDDASSDSNPEIIMEYAEKYPDIIRPVLLKENYWSQGRSKFFEVFLPIAKGKYVAFCEGDDYWIYEGKLQQQVDFLESHPDYSMCFHNHYMRYMECVNYEKSTTLYLTKDRRVYLQYLLLSDIIQTASVMGRKSLLDNDIKLKEIIAENKIKFSDYIYFASFFNSGKVFGFAEFWSVYRKTCQSVTENNISKMRLLEISIDQLNTIDKLYGENNRTFRTVIKKRKQILLRGISILKGESKLIPAIWNKCCLLISYPGLVGIIYCAILTGTSVSFRGVCCKLSQNLID